MKLENTHHGCDGGEGERNLSSAPLQGRFGNVPTLILSSDLAKIWQSNPLDPPTIKGPMHMYSTYTSTAMFVFRIHKYSHESSELASSEIISVLTSVVPLAVDLQRCFRI